MLKVSRDNIYVCLTWEAKCIKCKNKYKEAACYGSDAAEPRWLRRQKEIWKSKICQRPKCLEHLMILFPEAFIRSKF